MVPQVILRKGEGRGKIRRLYACQGMLLVRRIPIQFFNKKTIIEVSERP